MIFFDIDDTLVTHSRAQNQAALLFWEAFADRLPHTRQEFPAVWDAVMQAHFAAFAVGQITFEEHRLRRMREIFGFPLSEDEAGRLFTVYLRHYEENWALFEDVLPCLDALRSYRLGIISNGNGRQQRRKLERLGIAGRFGVIVISEEVGAWKPDPAIFLEACRRAGTALSECVYVGDSLTTDAQASRAAGMHGVWLNRRSLPGTAVSMLSNLEELTDFIKTNRERR